MQTAGPPGLGLGAKAHDPIIVKSKEVKIRWSNSRQIWENLLRMAMAKKRAHLPMMISGQ
jgi:hypothetical protein